jgi:hypothetical protein
MKQLVKESLQEFLNEEEQVIKGEIETGLTLDDLDKREFLVGLAVEKEHSTDLAVQETIVKQHLSDNPKYYSEGMKKGLFDEVEAMNLYKKYFIDKKDPDENEDETEKEE